MNVVSTSPSGTEICYALGVEPVAVSHACDYPPPAREKPRIDELAARDGWDHLAAVVHPDAFGDPPADVVRLRTA